MTVKFVLEADQAKAVQGFLSLVEAQKKSETGFKRQVTAAQQLDKSVAGVVARFVGPAGLSSAIALLNRAYERSIELQRTWATESKRAIDQTIAFAALQEGGTKARRVREAGQLGAEFGVRDIGLLFGGVQGLQSAIGAARPTLTQAQQFKGGMAAMRTVLRATQLGVPIDAAIEAELIGLGLGLQPGQNIRNLFAAGQISARDPAVLARAAPSLAYFQNQVAGTAIAAQIAGIYGPKLETYLGAAGIGLGVGGGAQPFFERAGLGAAGPIERIQYLAQQGISTTAQLKGIGIGEQRRQAAISLLVRNAPGVAEIARRIPLEAQPGVLARQRAEVEKELPLARASRRIDILRAMQAMQGLQPQKEEDLLGLAADLVRGTALRELGLETTLFYGAAVDEEGRASARDAMSAVFAASLKEPEMLVRFGQMVELIEERVNRAMRQNRSLKNHKEP